MSNLSLAFVAASFAVAGAAFAAVPLTGSYSQSFDSMGPNGTRAPGDWTAGTIVGSRVADGGGAIISRALVVDNGGIDTVGQSFNYGNTGDSDRAIGAMGTTNDGASGIHGGDRAVQVALINDTETPITALDLSFAGEQWRINQGTAETKPEKIRVFYSTSPNSGWHTLGDRFSFAAKDAPAKTAVDGNLDENRRVISGTYHLPTPVAAGGAFYIRWLDWNENSTADHGLAVDDVSISIHAP